MSKLSRSFHERLILTFFEELLSKAFLISSKYSIRWNAFFIGIPKSHFLSWLPGHRTRDLPSFKIQIYPDLDVYFVEFILENFVIAKSKK